MMKWDLQNLDRFDVYDHLNAIGPSGVRPPDLRRAMLDLRECALTALIDGLNPQTKRAMHNAHTRLDACLRRHGLMHDKPPPYKYLMDALFIADLIPHDYTTRLWMWERYFGTRPDNTPLLF